MVGLRKRLEGASPEIEAAIRNAEQGSSGEIVVVVSRVAGFYSWHEAVISFLTAIGFMSLAWQQWQGVDLGPPGGWDTGPVVRFHLGYVILTLVAGFLLGQLVVLLFPKVVGVFASKKSMRRHAERAAALAYRRYRVSETRCNTGVMIFLAEMEQTVVVLGDDHISENITSHEWEAIRDKILEGVKSKKPVEGMIAAIELAGELLRKHCPSTQDRENELPDKLYFR